MNVEDIFKRCKADNNKIIPYGFKQEDNHYIYSTKIIDDTFRVDVIIEDEQLDFKVYDLSFDEEYTNHLIHNQKGDFVGRVRKELSDVLGDIKDKCTIPQFFVSKQANRITQLIIDKYGDTPEFPWESSPGHGIFRNPNSEKWYALIMYINQSKIGSGNNDIEVINVKLDEQKIPSLVEQPGIYPAYHMSKKSWVTISLDDTLSDEQIMTYIDESYQYTIRTKEWLVPANPKYYDIMNHFKNDPVSIWKQSSNIRVGDIVYLYVAAPFSAILYQCEVIEADIPYDYNDPNIKMKKVMKIKMIKEYNPDEFTFGRLKTYGVNAIRGSRKVPKKLSEDLNR